MTEIVLWESWPGANQIWTFTERVSIEYRQASSLTNHQGGIEGQSTDPKACFHRFLV
jgi:hypothetical protein